MKKIASVVAAGSIQGQVPRQKQDDPVKNIQQCTTNIVLVIPSLEYQVTNNFYEIQKIRSNYYQVFVSQFATNPPFTPPRFIVV
ncbi:MAG: hypothetical protein ACSLE0_17420 [Chitinophagaceae bacterium]